MRLETRTSSRFAALARTAGVLLWLASAAVVSAHWVARAQQPQAPPRQGPIITGESRAMEPTGLTVSRRRFEAGARSAWHSHERGQLLFVEEGRARLQKRGQPVRDLGAGESDYTPPGLQHWHGAVPDQHYIQVAVGFGGGITWMEEVSDEEYRGKP